MKLEVTHQTDPKEWEMLIERFSGSVFLRPECLSMRDEGDLPCYFKLYDDHQEVTGIAFGVLSHSGRRLLGRFIRSLYLPTLPLTRDCFDSLLDSMLKEIIEYGREEKVLSITVDSYDAQTTYGGFEQLGFKTKSRWEFLWDLRGSEEEIWDSMDPHHKRYAKYGEKKGLVFRENNSFQGLERLIELLDGGRERMRSKGADDSLPSLQEFQAIKKRLIDQGYGSIFLSEREGKANAALLVAVYQRRGYLIYSGANSQGYQLRAPLFAFWNTAMELKRRGITEWNLGPVPWGAEEEASKDYGIFKFKQRLGAKQVARFSGEMHNVNRLRATAVNFGRAVSRILSIG